MTVIDLARERRERRKTVGLADRREHRARGGTVTVLRERPALVLLPGGIDDRHPIFGPDGHDGFDGPWAA